MRTIIVVFEAENMWKTRTQVAFSIKPGQSPEDLVISIKKVTKGRVVSWFERRS